MLKHARWFALASVVWLLCISAQAQTVLRLNEIAPEGGPESAALSAFKKSVEAGTKGQVQVDLHFGGMLGNVPTSLEKMMAGELDVFSSDLGAYLPLIIDEIAGSQLPFLLPDNAAARGYLASAFFDEGKEKVIKFRRIRFLETAAYRGPSRVIASRRTFKSLAELSGATIAIFPAPSKAGVDVWRALGVSVAEIDWKDAVAQLNQHAVDAVIAPSAADLQAAGIPAVAPIIGPVNDFPQIWQISINDNVWQKLDPGQQSVIAKAAEEAAAIFNRKADAVFKAGMASHAANHAPFAIDAVEAHQFLLPTYARLVSEGGTSQRVLDTANAAIASRQAGAR